MACACIHPLAADYFASEINETIIMEMADAMVATGMKDAGYEYVNVDAGYLTRQRDPTTGKLVVDKTRFPSGMRALADHVRRAAAAEGGAGRAPVLTRRVAPRATLPAAPILARPGLLPFP